jgi:membrane dipeptidase
MIPIIDSHLDLAINAIAFDRDLSEALSDLNSREKHMTDHPARGNAVVTLPEMRRGGVVLTLGSLLARNSRGGRPGSGFGRVDIDFTSPLLAFSAASGQLAYYQQLERSGEITLIRNQKALNDHWARATGNSRDYTNTPVGLVLSMEGSDPIMTPFQAKYWWDAGLRVTSLVHYGQGTYAAGTGISGPVTGPGIELLKAFGDLGMILDVSHLSDLAFDQALDLFSGPVLASHNNCRALVSGSRQLTDAQIKRLAERGGIIGVAFDAWMLDSNWIRGKSKPDKLTVENVVDHIDHICSLTGSAAHAGIGSDLDGGFGTEQAPRDVKSIADLQKVGFLLESRGYTGADIDAILHGNWLAFLRHNLPAQ